MSVCLGPDLPKSKTSKHDTTAILTRSSLDGGEALGSNVLLAGGHENQFDLMQISTPCIEKAGIPRPGSAHFRAVAPAE